MRFNWIVAAFPVMLSASAFAQPAAPATQPARPAELQLNFPDNVELRVLIEFVSQRLKFNVYYDQQAVAQQVTVRAPNGVTEDTLLQLLESILQFKGLAIVDAEQPGWKRIVQANALLSVARPATLPTTLPIKEFRLQPTTLVLKLEHADPQKADTFIKPFLSQPGGNSIALPDQHLLIVTDFGSNTARVGELLRMIDRPEVPVVTRVVNLVHIDADQAATRVSSLLAARMRARGPAATGGTAAEVIPDPRTNQLALIGSEKDVIAAESIAKSLDIELPVETKVFTLRFTSPERVEAAVRQLISVKNAGFQTSTDPARNALVVRAPAALQDSIADIVAQMDRELISSKSSAELSPIRFYRLENTTADEALQTIEAISDSQSSPPVTDNNPAEANSVSSETSFNPRTVDSNERRYDDRLRQDSTRSLQSPSVSGRVDDDSRKSQRGESERRSVRARNATITADPNTNSIIVVAAPETQAFYERLIKTLDRRRPQVLIECTVVTLDTSRNFSLGVEASTRGGIDRNEIITFSSFGLSRVGTGADLGRLSILPGLGFNGAVISTDVADVVVKALLSSGRAEVVSAPRILVNDNATGTLASVQEAPFTSVNASSTVATTSFAGYASAGTSINLTPHVSEGDFLQLEYTISLNSFTGTGGAQGSTPPPRQTNQLQSRVTIPDGSTIIVGGLNRRDRNKTINAIPLLGEIPILRNVFGSQTNGETSSTLFVFIRPIILRDDRFADLKFYSQSGVAAAALPAETPVSEPLIMR